MAQDRDSVQDIWGQRTPYKHEWPVRVDYNVEKDPDNWVQSACLLCSNGCGMDIGTSGGKIVGVRGRATDRVNKGRLGPKGLNTWVTNAHKDRLTHPMIRKNGKLERATWDEAMTLIVDKSKDIVKRITSHGIGFYTSGQLFLEEYYALAMVGKAGLNTLHMDGNTRLCTATAAAAMRESFGSDGQPGSYTDVDYTDCLFLVGHNVSATQTVLWARMLDRLDGPDPPKLIVIDPRRTNTAKRATVHLAPKIGTNLALLNGLQHLLFENDHINEQFVKEHVIGREALEEKVRKYTPEYVESITNVPKELIVQAAKILGTTKSLLSTALQGVYQSNQATASACAINNINLLTGHIGRPGSGIFQMNGQPTAQNNREAGCDGEFPAFRNYANANQMQDLADIWNIDVDRLPHWNQPTHIENMLSYIEAGSIEMFWISGTNPLVSLPNLPRTRDLLLKKELFVVAQDIFHTETTAIADVVLPAAMWAEKTGCFTNVDRTTHLSHKAIEPPGEAKSDLEIFLDYSKRMDFRNKDGAPLMPWTTSEEVFNDWKRMSKGRPCDYSEMSYAKLTGGSGVQWPCTAEYPFGKERLFDDGIFFTSTEYCESYGHDLETGAPISKADYNATNPDGRAILKACDYVPDLEQTSQEFPLHLSTGRNTLHFHTRTKTGRTPALQNALPEPRIHLNEIDAQKEGLQDGDWAVIKSARGKVEMKVEIGNMSEGNTFIPFHFGYFDNPEGPSRAANELTRENWDSVSKQPMFKSGAISVQKADYSPSGEVKLHSKAPNLAASRQVAEEKPDAQRVGYGDAPRERHLEIWLGATERAFQLLSDRFESIESRHTADPEIMKGMQDCDRILTASVKNLSSHCRKYEESGVYDHTATEAIFNAVAPADESPHGPYESLCALMGLFSFMAYLEIHLDALVPCSAALWDKEFISVVKEAQQGVTRVKAWLKSVIAIKSPQTLIVPSLVLRKDVKGTNSDKTEN